MITPEQIRAVQWFAATIGSRLQSYEVKTWLQVISDNAVQQYIQRCVELHQIARQDGPIAQNTTSSDLLDSGVR